MRNCAIQLGKIQLLQRDVETSEHSDDLLITPRLSPGVLPPSERGMIDPNPGSGVQLNPYSYRLEDTGLDLCITEDGLNRSYGLFGTTGSGKTYALMHILKQLFSLDVDTKTARGRFGGLILDPKGVLVDEVRQLLDDAGRSQEDLIVIGAGQKASVNIINAPLRHLDLGAALSMAAQSAGIGSIEASWMNELLTIFGATIHILHATYNRPPTLRDVAMSLLQDVPVSEPALAGGEGNGRAPMIQEVIEQDLEATRASLSNTEQADLDTSCRVIGQYIHYDSRNYGILRSFIQQSFGSFLYSVTDMLVQEASGPKLPLSIYEDVVVNGKILLVSPPQDELRMRNIICSIVKNLFQWIVLSRKSARFAKTLGVSKRPLFLLADEYSDVATEVPGMPSGDARFFSQCREFDCMALVATQSYDMAIKNLSTEKVNGEVTWKALAQNFAAKIFLKLDPSTAEAAQKLIGEREYLVKTWDRRFGKSGSELGVRSEIRERVELPQALFTQGFVTGEAVVVGDLTGGRERPKVEFLYFNRRRPPAEQEE